ncbi:hypothetical protein ES703_70663 [subsurface metagenome]
MISFQHRSMRWQKGSIDRCVWPDNRELSRAVVDLLFSPLPGRKSSQFGNFLHGYNDRADGKLFDFTLAKPFNLKELMTVVKAIEGENQAHLK